MEDFSIVRELIDLVKEASPLVWEAARRQVQVSAVTSAMWAVVMAVVFFFLFKSLMFFLKTFKEITVHNEKVDRYSDSRDPFGWVVCSVFTVAGLIITGFLTIEFLSTSIEFFYAPDYHTIKMLIDTVKQ